MDRRGQAELVGIILLFGVAAAGSVALLVLGSTAAGQSQDTVEVDRVEKGFVSLGQTIDTVGRSDDGVGTIALELPDEGDSAVRRESTGRIVLSIDDGTDTEIVNRTIGAVAYSHDGERFAYQAGGIWRGTGNATRIVSAPEVSYQGGTLTLPITDVEGDQALSHGPVSVHKQRTVSPLNDVQVVTGEIVTLEITSDYYVGWANYFRERIEGVTVRMDHANRTAVVTLAQPSGEGVFEPGIVASGDVSIDVSNGDEPRTRVEAGGSIGGSTVDNLQCPTGTGTDCVSTTVSREIVPLDRAIELKTSGARDRCGDGVKCVSSIDGGDTFVNDSDGGTYYVSGNSVLGSGDTATIDLSGGNVTLIVDGHLALAGGTIKTINGDTSDSFARVYLNHSDVAIAQQGSFYADSGNAARLQVYGTSETHIQVGQVNNGEGFEAAVYAPGKASSDHNEATDLAGSLSAAGCAGGGSGGGGPGGGGSGGSGSGSSYDICIGTGAGTVEGALIGGSVKLSQSANFSYDRHLSTMHPTLSVRRGAFPPRITYLHVSVYEVAVEDE